MGLDKGPFVVADTVSVDDPYGGEGTIVLPSSIATPVATINFCVKNPLKTQVSLDSMVQIAVLPTFPPGSAIEFAVTYQVIRDDNQIIASLNDEMDYITAVANGRHTNFPNFPVLDENPHTGINTYELVCTRTAGQTLVIFAGSRSLKATVFTL
ncbi:hypothetical protein [Chengkuizengella axinellae]|uniref:Uncharacterized protein n=1 Tax=Chengkuizengella axinellae TaxID=3064388 RepID=A0ABT9IYD4_9BACL|nr:hypothetical protein [Chengkuizengella sp. 2205SS18-9]MDP5274332.1 hypothetical protein [Chengkuizengella sp. 2205SS18-9]